MRSRTIREGSVGLLILLGLGLFGLLILWIRGINLGTRSYRFVVEFDTVGGMQAGAPVRYRGVNVGTIVAIRPGPNAVDAEIEISPASLLIPEAVLIEANQSGLIGETSIDMIPLRELSREEIATNPLAPDCEESQIICQGDRLTGEIGVSFDSLIRSTVALTELFTDPVFYNDIRTLTRNTSDAAAGVATLTAEVTDLTQLVEQELGELSNAAASSAIAVGQAADQIGLTASQVNSLLTTNRAALVGTLNNINQASLELQQAISSFTPILEDGEIIENLETLSANAAAASTNLRDLTEGVGSSENILLLQQTLDSARSTFQNAQKITADLDELTGDPEFRENLRELVNGLSGLVSSTQHLHQQTEIARILTPAADALNDASAQSSPVPTPPVQLTRLPVEAEGTLKSDHQEAVTRVNPISRSRLQAPQISIERVAPVPAPEER